MILSYLLQNLNDSDKNLVRSILNKFATKYSKRFPPHQSIVPTLPCKR